VDSLGSVLEPIKGCAPTVPAGNSLQLTQANSRPGEEARPAAGSGPHTPGFQPSDWSKLWVAVQRAAILT